MLKYFGLISVWTVAIAMSWVVRGAGQLHADPTDDFSFTLAHAPQTEVYSLLSVKRVTEILADHLDLFPRSQAPKLARHLVDLCRRHRFDPAFILSLIQVESSFKVKVQSPVGAVGLMQVMPATGLVVARHLGINFKSGRLALRGETAMAAAERVLGDPFMNLTIGVAYLAMLRDHYQGLSPYFLVAAYNVGPARMDELLSRKNFRPVTTLKYFKAIRAGVPHFRTYKAGRKEAMRAKRVRSRHVPLGSPKSSIGV